jgi:hypothetical protein
MRARLLAGMLILAAAGLLLGFRTDALRANWKFAGDSPPGKEGEKTLAFYDAENIEYLAEGDVKVWVKCVSAAEIEDLVAHERGIVKKAADKTAQSYYPPYFLSNLTPDADADRYIEMIAWEEAANHADIKTREKRLYEIKCREGKIQIISAMTYKSDGTTTFASDFDRWAPITPDSTGDTLRKLLCR